VVYRYQPFGGSFCLHLQGITVSQVWKNRRREKKTVQVKEKRKGAIGNLKGTSNAKKLQSKGLI
jgi:hypothetical protein